MTPRLALGASTLLLVIVLVPAHHAASASAASASWRDAEVVGRVVGADGVPLAGVAVDVVLTDTGTYIPFIMSRPGSSTVAKTTTGPDGSYRAVLPSAYVAGTETDYDWIVTATLPAGAGESEGATSSFELEVNTAVQEAPDLPLWSPTPVVSIAGYKADVSIPGGEVPGTVGPVVRLGGVSKRGASGVFDLRVLETDVSAFRGVSASASASADITVQHSEGRTIYHQGIHTPTLGVRSLERLVPPSRGAPCRFTLDDGQVYPEVSCEATDGWLDNEAGLPQAAWTTTTSPSTPEAADQSLPVPQREVVSITVDLRADTVVDSATARMCDDSCVVEVSADGSSWVGPAVTEVETLGYHSEEGLEGDVLVATFDPPVVGGRFVRVSRPGYALEVSEISAWPPPSPPGAPDVFPAGPESGYSPIEPPSPGRGRPLGPRLLAAVLLGAVGSCLAAEAIRRQQRRFESDLSSGWRQGGGGPGGGWGR